MNREFINDSTAKGAAFLDRKVLEKNAEMPILRGNAGNTGNKI